MGDNKISIRIIFHSKYNHIVGKTISFTTDEANVDDL